MITATLVTGTLTTQTGRRPRRSLEELVDRLMAALTFREEPAAAAENSLELGRRPRRSLEELVDRVMAALTFRDEPATATENSLELGSRLRRSLEEMVGRLMATLTFGKEPESPVARDTVEMELVDASKGHTVVRAIHEARRLRQAADLDGALEVLASAEMTPGDPDLARWTHSEWKQLVKRRFGHRSVLVYNQGTGRSAALATHHGGTLEVVAALGMRWRPGKIVSRRSLRGLRPLTEGASWS